MRFPKRDLIATGLVIGAGLTYALWAMDSTVPGLSSTRASGIVVLAFGFAASASAVVPSFDQLLRGNKAYLATTALLGVVALIGGVAMLVAASDTGLSVVMTAIVVLWLIATTHHVVLARNVAPTSRTTAARDTHPTIRGV